MTMVTANITMVTVGDINGDINGELVDLSF